MIRSYWYLYTTRSLILICIDSFVIRLDSSIVDSSHAGILVFKFFIRILMCHRIQDFSYASFIRLLQKDYPYRTNFMNQSSNIKFTNNSNRKYYYDINRIFIGYQGLTSFMASSNVSLTGNSHFVQLEWTKINCVISLKVLEVRACRTNALFSKQLLGVKSVCSSMKQKCLL